MKINELYAYIAAMVDGEGSICLIRVGKANGHTQAVRPNIGIDNTHRYPSIVARKLFGGNTYRAKLKSGKVLYRWHVSGGRAQEALKTLLPYLKVKRKQAKLVISCPMRKVGHRNRPITDVEIQFRENLATQVRQLNLGKIGHTNMNRYNFPECAL